MADNASAEDMNSRLLNELPAGFECVLLALLEIAIFPSD